MQNRLPSVRARDHRPTPAVRERDERETSVKGRNRQIRTLPRVGRFTQSRTSRYPIKLASQSVKPYQAGVVRTKSVAI